MLRFLSEKGQDIWINPVRVLCVMQSQNPDFSEVHFAGKQIFVSGTAADVAKLIEGASAPS